MSRSAPVIIFGAGKTGRGFAAHLADEAGVDFVLVDRDRGLIENLKRAGEYRVEVLGDEKRSATLRPARCFAIEEGWQDDFDRVSLCFTAVFGNKLPELAVSLAAALTRRYTESASPGPLDIITCENLSGAARVLREAVEGALPDEGSLQKTIREQVGFVEGMILKTCLGPAEGDSALSIRAENLFELPCDAAAFRGELPEIPGLAPVKNFSNQLVRKIYTYNSINAVITYLGARKGLTLLSDAARDPEIQKSARRAGDEASDALVCEFGFDADEQKAWKERALEKFADPEIPDTLERNGADPRRKLGRDDRLIGPAGLALEHGIEPSGLSDGIFAAFHFADPGEAPPIETYAGSVETILTEVSGLATGEPLFDYLVQRASKEAGSA